MTLRLGLGLLINHQSRWCAIAEPRTMLSLSLSLIHSLCTPILTLCAPNEEGREFILEKKMRARRTEGTGDPLPTMTVCCREPNRETVITSIRDRAGVGRSPGRSKT